MILDQAALIPPALNGVNAIFQVAVIRAGVKGAGVKLGPAELRPIRYMSPNPILECLDKNWRKKICFRLKFGYVFGHFSIQILHKCPKTPLAASAAKRERS